MSSPVHLLSPVRKNETFKAFCGIMLVSYDTHPFVSVIVRYCAGVAAGCMRTSAYRKEVFYGLRGRGELGNIAKDTITLALNKAPMLF